MGISFKTRFSHSFPSCLDASGSHSFLKFQKVPVENKCLIPKPPSPYTTSTQETKLEDMADDAPKGKTPQAHTEAIGTPSAHYEANGTYIMTDENPENSRDDISTNTSTPNIRDIFGQGRSAGGDGKGIGGAPSPINDLKMPPVEI